MPAIPRSRGPSRGRMRTTRNPRPSHRHRDHGHRPAAAAALRLRRRREVARRNSIPIRSCKYVQGCVSLPILHGVCVTRNSGRLSARFPGTGFGKLPQMARARGVRVFLRFSRLKVKTPADPGSHVYSPSVRRTPYVRERLDPVEVRTFSSFQRPCGEFSVPVRPCLSVRHSRSHAPASRRVKMPE